MDKDLNIVNREFNAEYINSVLNHPSVRGGALVRGVADCQPILDDHRNYLLSYDGGAIFFFYLQNGIYDIHIQALKEGRGEAFRCALEASFDYMFSTTDCTCVVAKVRKDNIPCMAIARKYMNKYEEDLASCYFNLRRMDQ